jgi:hypothetical protein
VASQTTMHTPVPVPARTPTPAQSPTDQFNHAMRDFLKKIADAQNKSKLLYILVLIFLYIFGYLYFVYNMNKQRK